MGAKTLAAAEDVSEIRGRVESLQRDDAARWGKMNVAQMMVHMREAYVCVLESRELQDLKPAIPQGMMRWLALSFPRKWPQGVETVRELKIGAPGLDLGEFAEDKAALLVALARFAAEKEKARTHPIFGSMRPKDWMRWGYLHADHHLRQFGR